MADLVVGGGETVMAVPWWRPSVGGGEMVMAATRWRSSVYGEIERDFDYEVGVGLAKDIG